MLPPQYLVFGSGGRFYGVDNVVWCLPMGTGVWNCLNSDEFCSFYTFGIGTYKEKRKKCVSKRVTEKHSLNKVILLELNFSYL